MSCLRSKTGVAAGEIEAIVAAEGLPEHLAAVWPAGESAVWLEVLLPGLAREQGAGKPPETALRVPVRAARPVARVAARVARPSDLSYLLRPANS
jgi:hypothetical protein